MGMPGATSPVAAASCPAAAPLPAAAAAPPCSAASAPPTPLCCTPVKCTACWQPRHCRTAAWALRREAATTKSRVHSTASAVTAPFAGLLAGSFMNQALATVAEPFAAGRAISPAQHVCAASWCVNLSEGVCSVDRDEECTPQASNSWQYKSAARRVAVEAQAPAGAHAALPQPPGCLCQPECYSSSL